MTGRAARFLGLACLVACGGRRPPSDPALADDIAFQDVRPPERPSQPTAATRVATSGPLRWLGKLDEGRRRARAERRNLVVWVTASWSAEAQRIERDVLPSHDIGPLLAPFVLVKVDVSDANEANEATMLELEVDTVPALVVLDDSGREVTRAGPMLDVESVRTALRSTD